MQKVQNKILQQRVLALPKAFVPSTYRETNTIVNTVRPRFLHKMSVLKVNDFPRFISIHHGYEKVNLN